MGFWRKTSAAQQVRRTQYVGLEYRFLKEHPGSVKQFTAVRKSPYQIIDAQ